MEAHWGKGSPLSDSDKEAAQIAIDAHRQERKNQSGNANANGASMGMKGIMAQWAQAGAMGVVAIVLFVVLFQVQGMHKEGVGTLERLINSERENQKWILQQLQKSMDNNTSAVNSLADEIRWLRKANGK